MSMTYPAPARKRIFWTIATVLLLAVSACAPHSELKSPCHVAALNVNPDCDFTPINTGTS